MFHEMHEEILMPEMSIIVNLHAKVGSLVHELCRPGMMVKAIIFATTLDQTKCQILAMNAATFAVDFFPFSRLVVGLSPGTFRIHTQLVVNLRVDLARILKVKHQIQSVPRPKVWIIPAIEVITFQRSQSQEITNHAINALKDAHGILLQDSEIFSLYPNNLKPGFLYANITSPSLIWRNQAQNLSLLPKAL
jgi:hypothetical protein